MPGLAAPLHSGACCSPGKDIPPLERGEDVDDDYIHRMVVSPTDPPGSAVNPAKLQELCDQITDEFADIMGRVLPELPLLQEVNHRIPLIDLGKRYHYHLP